MKLELLSPDQSALWQRVQSFLLDDPKASLPFSERLARENGWTLHYTLAVIEEYKRFMFLICITDHPLTPSDQVDQVWHLHLVYTRSYWDQWCKEVLQRSIHHSPTQGGKAEGQKYGDLYERTLARYAEIFGKPAPADIWPIGAKRFSDIHFQRVNTRTNWIIPKPFQT